MSFLRSYDIIVFRIYAECLACPIRIAINVDGHIGKTGIVGRLLLGKVAAESVTSRKNWVQHG